MKRFSLRAFLVFVTMIAVICGLWCNSAIRQRRAVEAIQQRGGSVMYSYQWDSDRNFENVKCFIPNAEPNIPRRLVNVFGIDMFYSPIYVCFTAGADDSDLANVASLPSTEALLINQTEITDAGLRHLFGLHRLRQVYAINSRITSKGANDLKQECRQCNVRFGHMSGG